MLGFIVLGRDTEIMSLIEKPLVSKFLALRFSHMIIAIAALASAYLTGISIFGLGIVLGLLLYYPRDMTRWQFYLQTVQFTSNPAIKEFSVQRERIVILLHATGNFGLAVLICLLFNIFLLDINADKYSLLLFAIFGIAALIRHWQTVYSLRSFQQAVITSHNAQLGQVQPYNDDSFGRFLDSGGLIGIIVNRIFKRNERNRGRF